MNQKDIIRMAREAGGADISMNGWISWVGTQSTDFLERFAKLVAEQSANVEREACAKVCINLANRWTQMGAWGSNTEFHQCVDAIRARGQA